MSGGLKKRAVEILRRLKQRFPDARCTLDHRNPLQLLVATILSAQCTDERVNKITPALFGRYRSAEDFAQADLHELEQMIRSAGFYRNKAKNIRAACSVVANHYGGRVPDTMEELLSLPGVGRKTANVILGNCFGKNEGIVVDTHVARISRRMGLTRANVPEKIERDLMAILPREEWTLFSHLLIALGRSICKANRPDCPSCPVPDLCDYARKEPVD